MVRYERNIFEIARTRLVGRGRSTLETRTELSIPELSVFRNILSALPRARVMSE